MLKNKERTKQRSYKNKYGKIKSPYFSYEKETSASTLTPIKCSSIFTEENVIKKHKRKLIELKEKIHYTVVLNKDKYQENIYKIFLFKNNELLKENYVLDTLEKAKEKFNQIVKNYKCVAMTEEDMIKFRKLKNSNLDVI